VYPQTHCLSGDTALLAGQRASAQLQQDTFAILIEARRFRSRLAYHHHLVSQHEGAASGLTCPTEAPSTLLPYGVLETTLAVGPETQVAQGLRPVVSCAWVGNRLNRIHSHLASSSLQVNQHGRLVAVATLVAQLASAEWSTGWHSSPLATTLPAVSPVSLSNLGET